MCLLKEKFILKNDLLAIILITLSTVLIVKATVNEQAELTEGLIKEYVYSYNSAIFFLIFVVVVVASILSRSALKKALDKFQENAKKEDEKVAS